MAGFIPEFRFDAKSTIQSLDRFGEIDESVAGFQVRVSHDDDADSPRTAFNNLGTMACKHRRYNLGDAGGVEAFEEVLKAELAEVFRQRFAGHPGRGFGCEDPELPCLVCNREANRTSEGCRSCEGRRHGGNGWFDNPLCTEGLDASELLQLLGEYRPEPKSFVALPLYLYDHSGLAISTGRFSCRWDSGRLGWIFVTLETLRADGHDWQRLTAKRREQVGRWLEAEVRQYDDYLQGRVFGYQLLDEDEEEIDSCWGFYGDHNQSGLFEYLQEELQTVARREYEAKLAEGWSFLNRLKQLVRNRVPLAQRACILERERPAWWPA